MKTTQEYLATEFGQKSCREFVSSLTGACYRSARESGWWDFLADGETLVDKGIINTHLLLIHSEVSEACEGVRKDLKDDHLPGRPMVEVELADVLIRVFQLAGAMNLDLGGAFAEKLKYNASRADHKKEVRQREGGKAY